MKSLTFCFRELPNLFFHNWPGQNIWQPKPHVEQVRILIICKIVSYVISIYKTERWTLNIFGFLPNGWGFSKSLFCFTENNFYNSQSCNSSCIQKLCAVLLLFVVVSGSRAVSMGCAFAKPKVFKIIYLGSV